MSNTCSQILWDDLVDDLMDAKFGEIKDDVSDCSSEASVHSETNQYQVTNKERKTIRSLDHQRCFVTNAYSHRSEIGHLLDKCNAGSRKAVDALHGLGVVHQTFNLADISNLILMSPELHHLWDKHATFVIVPSQNTRSQMIQILLKDRNRLMLAKKSKQVVEPRQLAFPEVITYDIILFQPSAFGSPRWSFQRAENHEDEPACYRIPERSANPGSRLEYLIKQDDGTQVREFLDIQHVTNRSGDQAINPYLMVMNALQKLKYWQRWAIGYQLLAGFVPDPVFTTTLENCEYIMLLIHTRTGVTIQMSRFQHAGDAQGDEEADMRGGRSQDVTTPSSASGALPELQSPASSAHLNHNASTKPGTQSWISRGDLDKESSVENWRQDVSEFSDAV